VKSTTKQSMAVQNDKFKKWAVSNQWLF